MGIRKDRRNVPTVELMDVQGYHAGRNSYDYEAYAFEGFKSNKYFTSDRFIPLDANHQRTDGKPIKGFGLEIETECWSVKEHNAVADLLHKIVFSTFPDDLFKLQYDSSLGVDQEVDSWGDVEVAGAIGVECITQIMTKQFIRNHYRDFKLMYDTYFRRFNFSCSETGNCGMHVNVSNAIFGDTRQKQIEAIRKLHYFINKNYDFACNLFCRDTDHTGYCEEMYYGDAKNMDIYGGSHGTCMNYSHFDAGRIEIRLVGGQSTYVQFRNTMETVFFLCDRVKKISWDELDDMTRVFKGCNQYVLKRLESYSCRYHLGDALETIKKNVKEENLELV